MILLVNVPIPAPSVVLVLNAVVGHVVILQHTPLTVTVEPPLLVIFPPLETVVSEIEEASVVVREGVVAEVVKLMFQLKLNITQKEPMRVPIDG